ncbi:MAG: D-alanine--D-alanine ligase [Endozoicomonadaceae bacterium]|nr:D-alanine--D-alanine ligase [Endozoicomonadaceae bacterium]MBE8232681.1 D-alanine--D-alanine ligase [Endozoicomonadaceae bacterium]
MSHPVDEYGHVAILYGGQSSERAISLISGQHVEEALKKQNIACSLIDTAVDCIQQLITLKPSRAFIALHGGEGEDGTIQGILEALNIPYTGSNLQASALAIDKYRTKLIWKGSQLPTPDFFLLNQETKQNYPIPCMVKATCQGSTIGTFFVKTIEDLTSALDKARVYGHEILIEQWINGDEFSVSILSHTILPPVRIIAASNFYDYHAKYKASDTQYLLPCQLPSLAEEQLKQLAYQAFTILGCSGWGRVDMMQDKQGKFWLIEVNTVPGLTPNSLVPKSAQALGINFPHLIRIILDQTMCYSNPLNHQDQTMPSIQKNETISCVETEPPSV